MPLDPRELDMFLNQARVKLPGASDSGIKLEFYDVVKEFLEDSNSWVEDVFFQPVADVFDYLITPKDGGQVIRLVGVFDHNLIPSPAFMQDFGTVHLLHAPNTTPSADWRARVVKNVVLPLTKDDVPVVPQWILRVYSVHILDGLLGKMMAQQDKSFSNSVMATYHLKRFRAGIQIARTAAIRQNLLGGQEWAYPRGWSAGSQRGGVSTAWPTRAF